MRVVASLIFVSIAASNFAAETAPAVTAETEKKFDWSKAETVEAFFRFAAGKYNWPETVKFEKAEYTVENKITALGALFVIDKATKDDVVKATYAAANIMGQTVARGATLDRAGLFFETPGGTVAAVVLPPQDLKKLGAESIKGAKADKAALNKMVAALVAKLNWKEVDPLVRDNPATKKP
jgi:hypothetical protein